MIRILFVVVIGMLLAASLDAALKEWLKANSNKTLSFFIVICVIFMLTGMVNSARHSDFSVNVAVATGYGLGSLGCYLFFRSVVLPRRRRRYGTLLIGFMLVLAAYIFLDSLFIQRRGR